MRKRDALEIVRYDFNVISLPSLTTEVERMNKRLTSLCLIHKSLKQHAEVEVEDDASVVDGVHMNEFAGIGGGGSPAHRSLQHARMLY